MTSTLNPYLSFKNEAKQAMELYQSIFGGQLDVMTFGQMGGEPADDVMHANLATTAGYTLMASDHGSQPGEPSPNGAVSLSGDDGDELRRYFAELSGSGQVTMPLEKQAWGDEFGMCVDKFGVTWLVNISAPAEA